MTFLDENSCYSIVRFMKKSEDGELVRAMIMQLENLFNDRTHTICIIRRRVKLIRFDGGGEYIGSDFCYWLNEGGITHEKTLYSLESNGRAERLNCTLIEMSRTILIDCDPKIR